MDTEFWDIVKDIDNGRYSEVDNIEWADTPQMIMEESDWNRGRSRWVEMVMPVAVIVGTILIALQNGGVL